MTGGAATRGRGRVAPWGYTRGVCARRCAHAVSAREYTGWARLHAPPGVCAHTHRHAWGGRAQAHGGTRVCRRAHGVWRTVLAGVSGRLPTHAPGESGPRRERLFLPHHPAAPCNTRGWSASSAASGRGSVARGPSLRPHPRGEGKGFCSRCRGGMIPRATRREAKRGVPPKAGPAAQGADDPGRAHPSPVARARCDVGAGGRSAARQDGRLHGVRRGLPVPAQR